jgi:hypothetical protein
MKRSMLMLAGLAVLMASPLLAEQTAKPAVGQEMKVCKTHCDIMKLEDQIDSYKNQQSSADKLVTKEQLAAKIKQYQKMLDDLNKKLES